MLRSPVEVQGDPDHGEREIAQLSTLREFAIVYHLIKARHALKDSGRIVSASAPPARTAARHIVSTVERAAPQAK